MTERWSELAVEDAEVAIRQALDASPGATVIIDFDETLWLRNSTEEYLRSLRPRWLAYSILLMLEIVRPWRFTRNAGSEHVFRDWIRVCVCTVAMPWSLARWRRQARQHADGWANQRLLSLLKEAGHTKLLVATLGTQEVVEPVLRDIDPEAILCAAGTLWTGYRIRALGKKAWIERNHNAISLADAIVITDSDTDADLLGSCRTPILVRWPEAEYRPALADSYVPFLYTQRAKRPGENYMLYGVLLEDIVLLWLAMAWLMPSPLLGAVGVALLHLSLWAVYEIGYVENDTVAVKYEAKPKVFSVAVSYASRVTPWKAWIASAAFGAAGIFLLASTNASALTLANVTSRHLELAILSFCAWMAYVFASRLAFWLYNRLDTGSRGHFYVVLQLFRLLGYALLLQVNWVGALILLSLVLGRWVKYLVYRTAGKTFDEDQRFLTLMFFCLSLCAGLAAEGVGFLGLQAIVALVWFAAYSHRRARAVARQARFVGSH